MENLTIVSGVAEDDQVSVDRSTRWRKCLSFKPAQDNWGLARISSKDALQNCSRWPRYKYERKMNVDVYIVDTGIRTTHEEFEGRACSGFTVPAIADMDKNLEFGPDHDYIGHGTYVAGIAAGKIRGVAKRARVIAVKAFAANGFSTYGHILSALVYAANSAKRTGRKSIINMSLGGPENLCFESAVRALVEGEGVPVVCSSGNFENDACDFSPAGMGGTSGDVITVGASTRDDVMISWSGYGTCVDLMAPGVGVWSAIGTCDSCYQQADGTSVSAPYVTGVVARYMAATGVTTPRDLKAWVARSAVCNKLEIGPKQPGTPNLLLQASCYKK